MALGEMTVVWTPVTAPSTPHHIPIMLPRMGSEERRELWPQRSHSPVDIDLSLLMLSCR